MACTEMEVAVNVDRGRSQQTRRWKPQKQLYGKIELYNGHKARSGVGVEG